MFSARHPEAELIAYVQGGLAEPDARRVADHLSACADCARAAEDFQRILRDLGSSVPQPPLIHWGAYRAELRSKLQARPEPRWGRQWLRRPIPLALSAAVAGVLLVLAFQSGNYRSPVTTDLAFLEETAVASRFDLLRQYSMLERLDLLEDLDVIRHLHEIPASREG
jgi:anti-sigma factor RsiW